MITIAPRFKIYSVALLALAGVLHAGKKPEEQKGYDKSKDVGLEAPKGAEILFDGTMESVRKNWVMWPKKDMEITWKIMDNPNGKGKTLMTDGGGMENPMGTQIAGFTCRTVMKFKSSRLREKTFRIRTIGR